MNALPYNGIKIDKIKKKVNYNYDTFRIVQVSRLDHERKGHHILIDTLNILVNNEKLENVFVDFIGEGKSLNYLQNLVKKHNLEKHVNFLGMKDRAYIYEHLHEYDILVQPSLYEGFGLTITESIAAKVPVLVSDIDGPMEIIEHGKYGNYFEKGNYLDCANKIIEIIERVEGQKALADKAYDHCVKNFSITVTAKKYLSNY